jgi:hypothetical protein
MRVELVRGVDFTPRNFTKFKRGFLKFIDAGVGPGTVIRVRSRVGEEFIDQ